MIVLVIGLILSAGFLYAVSKFDEDKPGETWKGYISRNIKKEKNSDLMDSTLESRD